MELRPYQSEARDAVLREWDEVGHQRTLLVLPTGCGKTIVFAKIIEERVRLGHRVLVLAHRGELLEQASDKLLQATGLRCAVEKAESSCIGSWLRVVVGSVQTLMRDKRLQQFPQDYFKAGDRGTALEPYLYQIADEMLTYCSDRKTVVFLPLVKTSQKFRDILNETGFRAAEVNGESPDRAQVLSDFESGKYDVLCNSMLLTEGWDCPSVDCVIVLRPTKVRSLYSQMVGRGTRLSPGKDHLLLLDFLWHTERHELCHPASLICENNEVARTMTENVATAACPVDIMEAEAQAESDVIAQREESLAKQLSEMRSRKRKLVDPLQFEMSIQAEDLASYVPAFGWEMGPPSQKQIDALEKQGILPDEIDCAGKAAMILDRLEKRQLDGLTTPKQIRRLEMYGFQHVGEWTFEAASNMISRIAAAGWRGAPRGVDPKTYDWRTGHGA